ncbi:MAG: hypothetical protein ACM3UZ_13155 [Acidobacteriota bacterium]
MKMKDSLAILLIAAFIPLGLAGCGDQKSGNQTGSQTQSSQQKPKPKPQSQRKVVKTPSQFVSQYKTWTGRLEKIAAKNDKLCNNLFTKKINHIKFQDDAQAMQKEVLSLTNEVETKTDITLSKTDQTKVKYDEIVTAFNRTAKDLNDFLYVSPHVTDAQVKVKYQEMIQRDYKNHLAELKGLLNSIK